MENGDCYKEKLPALLQGIEAHLNIGEACFLGLFLFTSCGSSLEGFPRLVYIPDCNKRVRVITNVYEEAKCVKLRKKQQQWFCCYMWWM